MLLNYELRFGKDFKKRQNVREDVNQGAPTGDVILLLAIATQNSLKHAYPLGIPLFAPNVGEDVELSALSRDPTFSASSTETLLN